MAPKRQRIGKGKKAASSSREALEFPDEFSPDQGFDVGYWDRDMEEVVRTAVTGGIGDRSWRRIYTLRESCRYYMPSKYVDPAALDYFGIREGAEYLMENIGWGFLLTNACYTSVSMLHEFYAYLKLTKEDRRRERKFTRIEFMLGGFSFDYTIDEFARIFGFDPANPSTEKGLIEELGVSKAEFWLDVNQTLFQQEKDSFKSYKATSLASRDLKYVHRVLTHTINGRADSNGNINKWDQMALYCMLQGLKFNGIQMLLDMFQRHTREEFRGRACGGGLVMLLAVRHGFPPGDVPLNAVKDNIFVDTAAFSKVVYPPGHNEEDEPQEEAAFESTWHTNSGRSLIISACRW